MTQRDHNVTADAHDPKDPASLVFLADVLHVLDALEASGERDGAVVSFSTQDNPFEGSPDE